MVSRVAVYIQYVAVHIVVTLNEVYIYIYIYISIYENIAANV